MSITHQSTASTKCVTTNHLLYNIIAERISARLIIRDLFSRCTYVSVTLRNVAVTSRRNVANQRSYVIIIARKEGGAWEPIIINAPQAVLDRGEGWGTAEVNGAGPSVMVVEKDVVGPSAMVVESDSVGPSPMVTEVGRYAQTSRPDGQLSQHL